MELEQIKLAVVGLGYVGLPLAVEFGKWEMGDLTLWSLQGELCEWDII